MQFIMTSVVWADQESYIALAQLHSNTVLNYIPIKYTNLSIKLAHYLQIH